MYAVNEPCRSRKSPVNRQRALCTTKNSSSYFPKEPCDSLTHTHVESTTHTHAHNYTHTHVHTSHHRHTLTKPHTHSPKICAYKTLQQAATHCNTLQHKSRQCIHTHCILHNSKICGFDSSARVWNTLHTLTAYKEIIDMFASSAEQGEGGH